MNTMSAKKYAINKGFDIQENVGKQKEIKNAHSNFLLAKYIGIGYYLGAPLLIEVFLGLLVDNFLKTKPLFIIIFIILGTIGTFYNLFKTSKSNF